MIPVARVLGLPSWKIAPHHPIIDKKGTVYWHDETKDGASRIAEGMNASHPSPLYTVGKETQINESYPTVGEHGEIITLIHGITSPEGDGFHQKERLRMRQRKP